MDQVQEIAVGITEECEPVISAVVGLAFERHTLLAQLVVGAVEIVYRDRDVAHAGRPNLRCRSFAFSRDDLDQRAILRFDKIITGVLVTDLEIQIRDVPIRETFRIRRCDSEVLYSFEHMEGLKDSKAEGGVLAARNESIFAGIQHFRSLDPHHSFGDGTQC